MEDEHPRNVFDAFESYYKLIKTPLKLLFDFVDNGGRNVPTNTWPIRLKEIFIVCKACGWKLQLKNSSGSGGLRIIGAVNKHFHEHIPRADKGDDIPISKYKFTETFNKFIIDINWMNSAGLGSSMKYFVSFGEEYSEKWIAVHHKTIKFYSYDGRKISESSVGIIKFENNGFSHSAVGNNTKLDDSITLYQDPDRDHEEPEILLYRSLDYKCKYCGKSYHTLPTQEIFEAHLDACLRSLPRKYDEGASTTNEDATTKTTTNAKIE